VRDYDILADNVVYSGFTDRFRHNAPGVLGSQPGLPGSIVVHRGGTAIPLGSKTSFVLHARRPAAHHRGAVAAAIRRKGMQRRRWRTSPGLCTDGGGACRKAA
jgi:hypothetical protein